MSITLRTTTQGADIARAGRLSCIVGAALGVVGLLLSLLGVGSVTAVVSGCRR